MLNRLTPLAWGMIATTFLGISGVVGYSLYSAGIFGGGDTPNPQVATNAPAPPSSNGGGLFGNLWGSNSGPSGPLGSPDNPIKFLGVEFHGYAPLLVANGGLTTQPGSLMDSQGVNVEYKILQDPTFGLAAAFESGEAHCMWRTSDFFAQEHPGLRAQGVDKDGRPKDGRAIMIVDNTQGADAIISTDPNINAIEDLAGHSVGLLQYTPSHGMLIDGVENSSLSGRRKASIDLQFSNDLPTVRAALESGSVQAAVLWDPDLSQALNSIPNAHTVYSTAEATDLIYDVVVCDSRFLDDPANTVAFQNFVAGWMAGVDAAEANPEAVTDVLIANLPFYRALAQTEGREFFTRELYPKIDWTNVSDNIRILGKANPGDTNHYERVYGRFDAIYRSIGATGNPNAPVIPPGQSFDYRFIDSLATATPAAVTQAQKPLFTFNEQAREQAAARTSIVAKPVSVTFPTGSSDLNRLAIRTIDNDMVPMIESFGSSYFVVSGNTDSTGSASTNRRLSQRRAQAVTTYLTDEWGFPAERFQVVGNGEDDLLCDEKDWDSDGYDNLDQCRTANRAVRLEVKGR